MLFTSKILDAFKLKSTREMENAIDNSIEFKEMPVAEVRVEEAKDELTKEETKMLETDNLPITETIDKDPERGLKEENKETVEEEQLLQEDISNPDSIRYIYPPTDLLNKGQDQENGIVELKQLAEKLSQTFEMFGIKADIIDISHGARFTRFEIQTGQGVRIRDVRGIENDMRLNLGVANLHIEAPISGKTTIGIDVENKIFSIVTLREIIESSEFRESISPLTVAIGKDAAGKVIVQDIANMAHLLIAGHSGTGKTVCISNIIMNILYKADPSEVKMILIDTKVINLSMFNGISHLLMPVVTEPKNAVAALHWGVAEMTSRYKKFADFNVRDLNEYNKKAESLKAAGDPGAPEKLPQILIIVDELADLMIVSPKETEESVCQLTQFAKVCGMHLIISTQSLTADVITQKMRTNIPTRLSFDVFSTQESKMVLDCKGAESLLLDGDMLFRSPEYRKPIRIQGTFVSDDEISGVVDFLSHRATGKINSVDVKEQIKNVKSSSGGDDFFIEDASEYDQYFIEAGRFVIEHDKASIGMLQRLLKIGFNRAARIMDQLAEAGVVGEEEGTKPRRILMNMEEFEKCIKEHV